MNFNNSSSPPAPAKPHNHNKTILGIIITASIVVIVTAGALHLANKINDNALQFSPSSSYQPTTAEITNLCTEKIREISDIEPTEYMIDVCVRGFNNELNSPTHLSANPTVSEIAAKCTELMTKEYGSAPKIAVNMCVGTILQGLNK